MRIRAKIMSSLLLAFGILTLAFVWSDTQRRSWEAQSTLTRLGRTVDSLVDSEMSSDIATMKTALDSLIHDPETLELFEQQDRKRLIRHARLAFDVLNVRNHITHLYFHRIDRTNLLRLHDPSHFNDKVDRESLRQAEATGLPTHGLEPGPKGTTALRVVSPVVKDGKRIGYMELGQELDGLVRKINTILGVHAILVTQNPSYNVIASSLPDVPEGLPQIARGQNARITQGKKSYDVIVKPFRRGSESLSAELILLHDSSVAREASYLSALTTVAVGFILMSLLLCGFYFFLGSVEQVLSKQQASLMASSKMVSLGEMAGGIAHEINNPLAVIKNTASQMKEILAEPSPDVFLLREMAEMVDKTTDRIGRIVQGLRVFCWNDQKEGTHPTHLAKVLEETLSICAERFKSNGVELKVDPLPPGELYFLGHDTQISQVLLNLLNNALDAVKILPERWVRISVVADPRRLEVQVTDSGHGIPPQVAEKLFQPFFTTKEVGKGTGLGLSIAQGIVGKHGGELKLDRRCPHTRFLVRLPRLKEIGAKKAA